ncbi:MAG: Ig-like domain-containing protein [Oscillospiraceae bacterium]|nr:Ig-like domain-containing protein [Oscillospiraceae bacterium]
MSKIICDICGTKYPESAGSCPICGYSLEDANDFLGDEFMMEDFEEFSTAKTDKQGSKKREIFDFDEVNSDFEDDSFDETNPFDDEDEPEQKEQGKSNVAIVVILTILIVALLAAAGFIFFKYFLPNMKDDEQVVPTTEAVVVTTAVPTTELTIPCEMLILSSGTAELSQEGQMFLLHVQATPENTTDVIVFTSADESIATVTEDGRITAVAEGETVIYITCGDIQTSCPVVVAYVEETEATTVPVETAAAETVPDETSDAETVPETTGETTAAIRTDVTLKLKQTDIRLGVYYEYQLVLDCDLAQTDVTWRSEHPHIATVDENGVVTAKKDGTTSIIVTYGDQEVSCIVRCTY